MATAVGFGVGVGRPAQQAQPQLAPAGREAVRRVGEQGDAEAVLGEVGEAVAGDFELRQVGGGVHVRRAGGDAELHLVGGGRGPHQQRERDLQQRVTLGPLDRRAELEPASAGVEPHHLAQRARLADPVLERDLRAQRRGGEQLVTVRARGTRAGCRRSTARAPTRPTPPGDRRRARRRCRARRAPHGRSRGRRVTAGGRRRRAPPAGGRSRAPARRRGRRRPARPARRTRTQAPRP